MTSSNIQKVLPFNYSQNVHRNFHRCFIQHFVLCGFSREMNAFSIYLLRGSENSIRACRNRSLFCYTNPSERLKQQNVSLLGCLLTQNGVQKDFFPLGRGKKAKKGYF